MKNFILSACFLFLIFHPLWGFAFTWNSDEKAKKLYVAASHEASHFFNNTEKWKEKYSALWDSYSSVEEKIDSILSQFSSTDIAVGLISGELKISGLTLRQFREKKDIIKLFQEAENSPLSCALVVAQTIEDPILRSKALATIAMTYYSIDENQIQKTIKLLSQSHELIQRIKDKKKKVRALLSLSGTYREIGQNGQTELLLFQASRAFEAYRIETNEYIPINPLVLVAYGYYEIGQVHKAIDIANKIDSDDSSKESVLSTIAVQCAEDGQFALSIGLAEKLSNSRKKTKTLIKIAMNYAEKDHITKAQEILNQAFEIKIPRLEWGFLIEDITKTLVTIAKKVLATNNVELALSILSYSLELVNEVENEYYKCSPFMIIANEYVKMSEKEKALPLLSQALEIAISFDNGIENHRKFNTLTQINDNLLEHVQFNEVIKLIKSIRVDENYIKDLTQTVNKYFDAGEKGKAIKLITVISEKIDTMEPAKKDKTIALINMSDVYNHIGQEELARQQLGKALEATEDIDESEFWDNVHLRLSVSLEIADKYFEIGSKDQARKILYRASENFDNIATQEDKMALLSEIFEKYIKFGENKLAKQIVSKFLENIPKIQSLEKKSYALAFAHRYYNECGYIPSENDKSILHDIISETNPMIQLIHTSD